VSAPETGASAAAEIIVVLKDYRADVVEIAGFRGRGRELEAVAASRGLTLPGLGRVVSTAGWLTLSVRPERWLVLQARNAAGARVALWQAACASAGAAVDLSSALAMLHLSGPRARELLARSCRVDLHESSLPGGRAIATVMAQVAVTIATIPSGLLLLTPTSTARHFREWLIASAKLCGLSPQSAPASVELFGSSGL
jgi:heterotetrameric sarcosine oxidase gamma subunit